MGNNFNIQTNKQTKNTAAKLNFGILYFSTHFKLIGSTLSSQTHIFNFESAEITFFPTVLSTTSTTTTTTCGSPCVSPDRTCPITGQSISQTTISTPVMGQLCGARGRLGGRWLASPHQTKTKWRIKLGRLVVTVEGWTLVGKVVLCIHGAILCYVRISR